MRNDKLNRLIPVFVFCCLSITFCLASTNKKTSKDDANQEVKINETTEYYEFIGTGANKRQVDKKTYEDNLKIEKDYRTTGVKKDIETLKAELSPDDADLIETRGIIYPPDFIEVVFKMNGNQVIVNGSSVDCYSVKVTVTSVSTPTTRFYRINNSNWYSFSNNTYFYDPGYYEIQVSNPYITDAYNFTILPGTSNDETANGIPDLISTRLVSKVVYHEDDQRATYSTSSIWDNPNGDPRYNVSVQVMWPANEATAFSNLSQTVNVRKYGEYTDWLGLTYDPEISTIWHSSTSGEFTGVEEDVNPISDIEARTIGYDTNLPSNHIEDIYTIGTVATKLYTYYEITLSISVQCNPLYLSQSNSTLHVFSTFTFMETALDLSPSEFWTLFFDYSAVVSGTTTIICRLLATTSPVGVLVEVTSFSLLIIYFIVKQYDGTTLGTNRKITHTIMSTLEV